MGALMYALIGAVPWSAGTYPAGAFSRVHAVGALLTPYAMGLIHYLDRSAGAAMKSFRPALRGDEALAQRLTYLLTTLPAKLTLAVGVLVLNWWVGRTLALHTVRRLSLVSRIYQRHAAVDLLKQAPLYALSRLTSQTTIGAVLLLLAAMPLPLVWRTQHVLEKVLG